MGHVPRLQCLFIDVGTAINLDEFESVEERVLNDDEGAALDIAVDGPEVLAVDGEGSAEAGGGGHVAHFRW